MIESDQRSTVTGGEGARSLTADAIAQLVKGTLQGDPAAVVRGIAPLDRAAAHELSFVTGRKYANAMGSSRAGIILLPPDLADIDSPAAARITVAKPHEALLAVIPHLYPGAGLPRGNGIHPTAVIGRGALLGDDVTLGANVVIGAGATIGDRVTVQANAVVGEGVSIGNDCVLWPGVVLYPGAELAERVLLHAGVRIGSDGYGYVFRDGRHDKIPHVGRCRIESDVEIGANSTVDRGSIDDTVIGAGTKIDNLVHIGHNVRIGRACLIMAQVGIAGSARIGDGCVIAGQAGLGGHIVVGDRVRIGGQAGVFGDVPDGETWSGYPARPHRDSLRATAALFKLPDMLKRIERLLDGSR